MGAATGWAGRLTIGPMTALGGLDGLGPVAATTPRASRRPAVDASLLDALSGPDGTSDPAPWPVDTGGLTAVGDVFPDALTVDLARHGVPTGVPDRPSDEQQRMRDVAAEARRDLRAAQPARPVAATARTAQNVRPPQAQRPGQNAWSTSGSGRPGQNAPRQAPPAARRTPAPARTAPTAPARPAYGSGSTGWSPGGTQSARDLMRRAREAGGLGLAATPFLRSGEQRAAAHQPTRSSTPQTVQQAGAAAQRSQQARSQWGSQHPRRSADRRTRRRSNGSAVFTVFVLAVVILFASGGAQAIIHLLTTLFGR